MVPSVGLQALTDVPSRTQRVRWALAEIERVEESTMKRTIMSLAAALMTAGVVRAQTAPQIPYTAQAFNPALRNVQRR